MLFGLFEISGFVKGLGKENLRAEFAGLLFGGFPEYCQSVGWLLVTQQKDAEIEVSLE